MSSNVLPLEQEICNSVSVDREQKRLKVVSFKMVLEEFDKNILVNKSLKLYPGFIVNIVGHFSKGMPFLVLAKLEQRHDCYEYMECKPLDMTKIDPTKDHNFASLDSSVNQPSQYMMLKML
ncbi:unnamed protein product [Rhizophagus irregularis]|nr:unnamed protein product [Rhizophagus irregularis]CAB5377551.1 unnamed protein product [Rhizophagus irregularis]